MLPLLHTVAPTRRRFLRSAATTMLATQLGITGSARAQTAGTPVPTPDGPGSVSGAPNLPAGFADTFTSQYVQADDVRLHAVVGGDGPPLLLIHGWPQTWYAWRMIMPALAHDFTVVAVDQRGIGLSDKPEGGYDAGSQANDMVALMAALGHEKFALYGTDTGMPIAYALAADHPDRVERLVVSEAVIAGITPSPPLLLPTQQLNDQLWHIPFNRLAHLNEQLVKDREDLYFGAKLQGLPDDAVAYYVGMIKADPDGLRGSFGQYRAFDASITQNQQRAKQKLALPVLAIGGEKGLGEGVINTVKLVADDLQTLIIPGSGHWVAEQAPDALLAALTAFLAPYKSGT